LLTKISEPAAAMKVQVYVKMEQAKAAGNSLMPLVLLVGPGDTAAGLRGRVEATEPLAGAFAGKATVVFDGEALQDGQRLMDCGVKEGSSLDLVVQISAQALAQQLAELLKAKSSAVSLEELGLLFSHRHGVSVGRVLEALGYEMKLNNFLEDHGKLFVVKNGCVSLVHADHAAPKLLEQIPEESAIQSPSIKDVEVRVSIQPEGAAASPASAEPFAALSLSTQASDTVQNVKRRVSEMELLPFPDQELLLSGQALDDGELLVDCFKKEESGLRTLDLVVRPSEKSLARQLEDLLLARVSRASSKDELSLLYCYRHGATVTRALKLLGSKEKFGDFLKRQKQFVLENGCVTLAPSSLVKAARLLDAVLEAATFLNIRRVERQQAEVKTQSHGQDDACTMKVTLFLEGLPPTQQGRWLPGLLKSVAAGLQERLADTPGIQSVGVADDLVQVLAKDTASAVELRLSPLCG
jgi:hypothetical protein